MKKARWWGMILRVLKKTGAMVQARGMIYKAVEQSVMLYGGDIWVVMGLMLKVLEGFHHRDTREITVITEKGVADREW